MNARQRQAADRRTFLHALQRLCAAPTTEPDPSLPPRDQRRVSTHRRSPDESTPTAARFDHLLEALEREPHRWGGRP